MLPTPLPQHASTAPIVIDEAIHTHFDSEAITEPLSAHRNLEPVAVPPRSMRGRTSKTRTLTHVTISKDEIDALFQM